jgi:ParB family chromosome partitioning protein
MSKVPCEVLDLSDDKAAALGFLMNYQHEDMNAQDEAELFARLIMEHHWGTEDIAYWSGLSERTVRARLALLTLPEGVQALVRDEKLSPGLADELHAFFRPEVLEKRAKKEEVTEREAELRMRRDVEELAQQMVNEDWTKTSVRIRFREYVRSLEPTHIPPPIEIPAPKPQMPMLTCEVCGLSFPLEEVHVRRICDKCIPKFNALKQRGE